MSLNYQKYLLKINFTGPILGSQPGKDTPASDYLRDKVKKLNPDANIEDEISSLPEELEKGTTGFHRDKDGNPSLFNYQVKGLLKECGSILNGIRDVKALKSKIDNLVFVSPRIIKIDGKMAEKPLERPLRAETMKGPRVSLARSEMIESGASIECEIEVLESSKVSLSEDLLRDLLEYGRRKGMGQWRNSGIYGQFEYELTNK